MARTWNIIPPYCSGVALMSLPAVSVLGRLLVNLMDQVAGASATSPAQLGARRAQIELLRTFCTILNSIGYEESCVVDRVLLSQDV